MNIDSDASYVSDVSDIDEMVNDELTNVIIYATVGDIYLAEMNKYGVPYIPVSIVDFTILKGDSDIELDTIYFTGGTTDVESYMAAISPQEAKKMGLTTIPEEERKNEYIEYTTDSYFELSPGEEYVFLLTYRDGKYFINTEGYGTFEIDDNMQTRNLSSSIPIKNVLTEKTSEIDIEN